MGLFGTTWDYTLIGLYGTNGTNGTIAIWDQVFAQ